MIEFLLGAGLMALGIYLYDILSARRQRRSVRVLGRSMKECVVENWDADIEPPPPPQQSGKVKICLKKDVG